MTSKRTGFYAAVVAGIVALVAVPQTMDMFTVMQLTGFVAMAVFALSQGFVWGFAGIMSFGQAAFLGLGAYSYAVAAINFGDSTPAMAVGILVPVIFAGLLGYFMFYGRISDAYVGVITMTTSIILFNLINSTSGDAYRVGEAALGGFNGIPSVPTLNIPGDPEAVLDPNQLWYVTMGCLILCYIALHAVLRSRFGAVTVAIRENETRVTLLGYDARFYKLVAFMISAAVAGLAGCLYTNWGAYISPTIFALAISAQAIIFVLVGGLGTLIGPILGAFVLQWLMSSVGQQSVLDANLVMGAVLIVFVLLVPKGVVPLIRDTLWPMLQHRFGARSSLEKEAHE
ncbi:MULTISPECIES: ABC transporter permease subunit [Thioclava]|uniref:Urea ABC transporter n=1 Tax=Thioclava kandeliae TaxID=3070818 RepID=A0ABV1SE20_9RHOB